MMPAFNPQMISPLIARAVGESAAPIQPPEPVEAPAPEPMPQPVAPTPAPAPQIVMKPILVPVPTPAPTKPKGLTISPEAMRRAQGLYPAEAAKKQVMIDNAKSPPTPSGAWGAPK